MSSYSNKICKNLQNLISKVNKIFIYQSIISVIIE